MDEEAKILSIQPMLRLITGRFAQKNGLQSDELFQEMQLTALKAVRTWDPKQRTLVSWMHFLVMRKLERKVQYPGFRERYGKHNNSATRQDILADQQDKHTFRLDRLLLEVSEKAAQAIQLALEEGCSDPSYIETLLHVSFGWSERQIKQIFEEIRNAL